MNDFCSGQLKLYSNVAETSVDWLWYPYIPFGKVTLLQGDPGCGKSTLMMNIISAVSTGGMLPDGRKLRKPLHVIYQCSEDGMADTIKPRLSAAGADCGNVAFLDEEMSFLTLNDDTIRRAIADFHAKLLVIDPVQAYLGDADLSNAMGMRKMLRQLSVWAAMYECAIVLIGHLNKRQGSKDLYRSLGSIDLVAAARSVLEIDAAKESNDIHVIRHIKSSLAPKGRDQHFIIDSQHQIRWVPCDNISDVIEHGIEKVRKQDRAAEILKVFLADGPMKVADVQMIFRNENISEKTVILAKKAAGIRSVKKDDAWYWYLPGTDTET